MPIINKWAWIDMVTCLASKAFIKWNIIWQTQKSSYRIPCQYLFLLGLLATFLKGDWTYFLWWINDILVVKLSPKFHISTTVMNGGGYDMIWYGIVWYGTVAKVHSGNSLLIHRSLLLLISMTFKTQIQSFKEINLQYFLILFSWKKIIIVQH